MGLSLDGHVLPISSGCPNILSLKFCRKCCTIRVKIFSGRFLIQLGAYQVLGPGVVFADIDQHHVACQGTHLCLYCNDYKIKLRIPVFSLILRYKHWLPSSLIPKCKRFKEKQEVAGRPASISWFQKCGTGIRRLQTMLWKKIFFIFNWKPDIDENRSLNYHRTHINYQNLLQKWCSLYPFKKRL